MKISISNSTQKNFLNNEVLLKHVDDSRTLMIINYADDFQSDYNMIDNHQNSPEEILMNFKLIGDIIN